MDAACTDGFETTFRRVALRKLVVAPTDDGVVGTNPAKMASPAYAHMAPACTHSFETTCRIAGWRAAPADNPVIGPIDYSTTIVWSDADSFERTTQGIAAAPADVGVVGANPAALDAACTDSFETAGRRVGLPLPVVAPADDAVVGTNPATMFASCTDSFEPTGRRVGPPLPVEAPADDCVVGTNPATMVAACTDSFEPTFRRIGRVLDHIGRVLDHIGRVLDHIGGGVAVRG